MKPGSSQGELSPVAVAVAPNGGHRTKADHPAVPLSPQEIGRTAAECMEAGACMIHVHVRDGEQRHLLDAEAYREAIAAVRRSVGERMVIQVTSEALGIYAPGEQMAVVREVRPEAVSLALRELAPDEAYEPAFAEFLSWLRRERIVPQIILYTPEEAARLDGMRRRGLVPFESIPVLYVLGRYTVGQTSHPSDLLPFVSSDMPHFHHWMTCAFGRHETACVTAAGLLGGHVRVGFENNLTLPNGTTARSNAELVGRTAQALGACGCALAGADTLRRQWAECLG
ncbi:BKACE family enzyme [Microvirga roseola]|uniref:3-keto-5-aminohexanoate cleavage protein n=1 Tax=Microvirga roseola TaxID=2883126 RepID=UPI001E5D5150|nr:3-keto-5-aminohexanoate cleavage protein [Microvirga roseola]